MTVEGKWLQGGGFLLELSVCGVLRGGAYRLPVSTRKKNGVLLRFKGQTSRRSHSSANCKNSKTKPKKSPRSKQFEQVVV